MESWLHNLTYWLQNRGWDIQIGLAKGARFNDPDAYLSAHGHIKPLIMNASTGTEEARIQAIRRTCASSSPDILVPIVLGSVFPAIQRMKLEGSRVRFIVPVQSTHPGSIQNVLDYFHSVDHVVGVSRLIEQFFLRKLSNERERIHYIKYGVASPILERQEATGGLRVGFVGRLENVSKRILDLLPLCEHLRVSSVPIEIHIFGDGPHGDVLRNELWKYYGACSVTFHGYIPTRDLYKKAYPYLDVLVMFSDEGEGNPLVLCEAMQHGVVPVVSRFLGHASEGLVRHGKNGFTFPVGQVEIAAKQIIWLTKRPDILAKFGRQAKQDVKCYEETRMYQDWEKLFQMSLCREPRIPRREWVRIRPIPPAGRLEKYGLPPEIANWVRRGLGRKFPHKSGFEEWPGSQPVSLSAIEEVKRCLHAIDDEAAASIYGQKNFELSDQV
jgi:hypothetical protein